MNESPQQQEPNAGVEIAYTELSDEALRAVIESFVLREGTEYGAADFSLEQKVAQVRRQLERKEARIVFDPISATVDVVPLQRERHRNP
jgi:uncharacterized protein